MADAELRAAFDSFDTDGDGKIESSELKDIIKKLGIEANDDDIKSLVTALDANNDGKITYGEFLQLTSGKFYTKKDKNALLTEFKKYDKDNTGFISADELHSVLSKSRGNFTLAEAEALIAKADKDEDGLINIVEFLGLFK